MNNGAILILTDLLLEPFFSDWTLNLLNHSGITKLSFATIYFKRKVLQQFLPKIYIPRLQQFAVNASRADLNLDDFAQFLQRHSKNLIYVTLNTNQFIRPTPDPPFPLYLHLPKLAHLALSSYYVPWFLEALTSNPTKGDPPCLTTMSVMVSDEITGAPNLDQALESIAESSVD